MLDTSKFLLQGSSRVPVMKESKITCYFSWRPQVLTTLWDMHLHELLLYSAQKENEFWGRGKKKRKRKKAAPCLWVQISSLFHRNTLWKYKFIPVFIPHLRIKSNRQSISICTAGHRQRWKMGPGDVLLNPVGEGGGLSKSTVIQCINTGWCCRQGFGFYDHKTSGTRATK